MLEIFGEPDWPNLASGILDEILGGLAESLNFILLFLPFSMAVVVVNWLKSKNTPNWIAAPSAIVVIVIPFSLYYLAYPYVKFPTWMSWFA